MDVHSFATPPASPADEPAPSLATENPSVADNPRYRTTSNEVVLREEIRAIGQNYMQLWRSGITVLPSLLVAISFVRKEFTELMIASGTLVQGQPLPLHRYVLGTLFLFVVAYSFKTLTDDLGRRWIWHIDRLQKDCDNALGVPSLSPGRFVGYYYSNIFLVFPWFDLFIRAVTSAEDHGFFKVF
jgi:hypothetical protein